MGSLKNTKGDKDKNRTPGHSLPSWEDFRPLVKAWSYRTFPLAPTWITHQDLEQEGWLGLWQAWQRRIPGRPGWKHYLSLRVRGAVFDSLRRPGSPRKSYPQQRQERQAAEEWYQNISQPLPEELFTALTYLSIAEQQAIRYFLETGKTPTTKKSAFRQAIKHLRKLLVD